MSQPTPPFTSCPRRRAPKQLLIFERLQINYRSVAIDEIGPDGVGSGTPQQTGGCLGARLRGRDGTEGALEPGRRGARPKGKPSPTAIAAIVLASAPS